MDDDYDFSVPQYRSLGGNGDESLLLPNRDAFFGRSHPESETSASVGLPSENVENNIVVSDTTQKLATMSLEDAENRNENVPIIAVVKTVVEKPVEQHTAEVPAAVVEDLSRLAMFNKQKQVLRRSQLNRSMPAAAASNSAMPNRAHSKNVTMAHNPPSRPAAVMGSRSRGVSPAPNPIRKASAQTPNVVRKVPAHTTPVTTARKPSNTSTNDRNVVMQEPRRPFTRSTAREMREAASTNPVASVQPRVVGAAASIRSRATPVVAKRTSAAPVTVAPTAAPRASRPLNRPVAPIAPSRRGPVAVNREVFLPEAQALPNEQEFHQEIAKRSSSVGLGTSSAIMGGEKAKERAIRNSSTPRNIVTLARLAAKPAVSANPLRKNLSSALTTVTHKPPPHGNPHPRKSAIGDSMKYRNYPMPSGATPRRQLTVPMTPQAVRSRSNSVSRADHQTHEKPIGSVRRVSTITRDQEKAMVDRLSKPRNSIQLTAAPLGTTPVAPRPVVKRTSYNPVPTRFRAAPAPTPSATTLPQEAPAPATENGHTVTN